MTLTTLQQSEFARDAVRAGFLERPGGSTSFLQIIGTGERQPPPLERWCLMPFVGTGW
jgi:hypothetical protein